MKKQLQLKIASYVITLLLLTVVRPLAAQTTLVAGDIAFTGYNSNDNSTLANEFSFVILRTGGVSAGTILNFTDNGWNTTLPTPALGSVEGVISWTSASALAQFTEVFIKVNASGNAITTISAGTATVSAPFVLSTGGDQIFAYQGTLGSPVFIAGIHKNANPGNGTLNSPSTLTGWDDMVTGTNPYGFTSSNSGIPPSLTNGVNAIMVADNAAAPFQEYDNAVFNCTGSSGASVSSIRSSLMDRANWTKQDLTRLTVPSGCTFSVGSVPSITTQPVSATVCAGSNATFSVAALNATAYQWQVDQGSGFTNISNAAPYSGATTSTLTISNTTTGLGSNQYRVVVTGSAPPAVTSDAATLTVSNTPAITTQPVNSTVCSGASPSFTVIASNATGYQWQVNQGSGFTNLNNTAPYSGAATAALTITGAAAGLNGYQYRVVVSGSCAPAAISNAASLTISSSPLITAQPVDQHVCPGSSTTFSVTASHATGYQWQVDQGTGFVNITNVAPYSGATAAMLTIAGAATGLDGNQYRVIVSGTCTPNATSGAAVLHINAPPFITTQPKDATVCTDATALFTVVASNAGGYQWQVDQGSMGFSDLTETPPYAGVHTSALMIHPASASLDGYRFRVIIKSPCGIADTSIVVALTTRDRIKPVFLSCPADIMLNVTPGTCSATASWTAPTSTDNCSVPVITATHQSGDPFNAGQTTVTYTAEDAAGNKASCSFKVTVTDNEAPVFTICPKDTTIDAGVFNYTVPVATDHCPGMTLVRVSGLGRGAIFQTGTSVETYEATDAAGNKATCSFVVTVDPTAVADKWDNAVRLYPNPASGNIYIASDKADGTAYVIELTDFSGKVVERSAGILDKDGAAMNVAHLPEGFYFVNLMMGEKRMVRKIVLY